MSEKERKDEIEEYEGAVEVEEGEPDREQRVVRYGGLYYDIKRNFKPLMLAIGVALAICLSFYYKLDYLLYFGVIATPTGILSYIVFRRLLRADYVIVLECNVERKTVTPYFIPRNIFYEFEVEGMEITFSDYFGTLVIIAEDVDLERKKIKCAWIHGLDSMSYMMTYKTFNICRAELKRVLEELAKYKMTLPVLVKKELLKLTPSLDELKREVEEKE